MRIIFANYNTPNTVPSIKLNCRFCFSIHKVYVVQLFHYVNLIDRFTYANTPNDAVNEQLVAHLQSLQFVTILGQEVWAIQ